MSVLETPRIYFSGQIAWDPIVTNNYDTFYNEDTSEPVYPSVNDRVEAFRKEAIAAVAPPVVNWDPHGTHRSTFFDAAVSGTDLGGGTVQNDPFASAPANFTGMLVDLEPYGTYTSQLFFDEMTFGIKGGCRIALRRRSRFTARYINFTRNPVGWRAGVASVVWQSSFAKSDLTIDAFDSPALVALQQALAADDVLGVTVQWNAYRTIYFNSLELSADKSKEAELSAELIKKLEGGGFQPNPARSMLVGVLGLWRRGEPAHEPCDRVLLQNGGAVATAHARVGADSITLDLSNSISETGLDLVKQNLGDLSVVAVDPAGGNPVTLATFGYAQYDTAAYLKSSGIVTLPIAPGKTALCAGANLELRDSSGTILLQEAALRAVPLVPNLYIDEGEKTTIDLQVYDRGVPAGAGIAVLVCVMSADGGTVDSTFTVTTGANGVASFLFKAGDGSITAYVPLPGPNPVQPSTGINPGVNTYLYVRVLPADDKTAQLPPTWDNVYKNVLANWKAMAPCMDNWLDLASEQQIRSFAPILRKLTDPAAFESYRFMPVTRDMTRGERTLLYNFLESPPTVTLLKAEAAEPAEPDFATLSRAMRRR